MLRSPAIATPRLGPAIALMAAALLVLRAVGAWAAPPSSAPEWTPAASIAVAARTHAAVVARGRLAPAKCEATCDDPPAPDVGAVTTIDWTAPTAIAPARSNRLLAGAPERPPPARGPPAIDA